MKRGSAKVSRSWSLLLVAGVVALGCGDPAGTTGTQGETVGTASMTGTGTVTMTETTGTASTDGPLPDSGSSSATAATGPVDACADVEPVDNPELWNCDTELEGTCPECHKCTFAWDGQGTLDIGGVGTVCIPTALDPVAPYEPCSYGELPGYDNCDAQSLCWNVDPRTGTGYCIPQCGVSLPCEESTLCFGTARDEIGCLPKCDPLAPECPAANEQCLSLRDSDAVQGWACLPVEPGLLPGYGEACGGTCAEGLHCIAAADFGPGCADQGCCTDLCTLDGSTACMAEAEGHTCQPCVGGIEGVDFPEVGGCSVQPSSCE